MSPPDEPSWADAGGPFKFLDYFTEDDAASFAGRARDVEAALSGVLKAPSFVLYGGSGTGKTSLLLAGLFPRLREQGLRPVYARTLTDPLADLRGAILGAFTGEPPAGAQGAELTDLLAELSAGSPVVLAFDQFEEFFIRFRDRPELKDAFIAALGGIAGKSRLDVKLLFSLRQEFLGELDDFRQHLPQLFDNEYRLKPLTAFGARQAIASQLRRAEVAFERRFLTRVVDLLKDYNFDPTILQIVCSEVYRQASRVGRESLRLTAADVDAVGDVRLLFRRYLDDMAASLPSSAQLTVRAVLDALIVGEHTRRAATFETIHAESTREGPEVVRQVLNALVFFRLVRRDEQGEESWFELTHERLTVVVREWLELDERFRQLRAARQLIANMARGEHWRRDPELLLTGHHLETVVAPVRDHLPLTPAETEYLARSAVFRRSRDPGIYWLGRYGVEESRRLVLEMLAAGDPKAVWGAARMARHVEDSEREVATACARKAALEENLEIAAEAYFSVLAMTRGAEHKKLMRQAADEAVEGAEEPTPASGISRRLRVRKLLGRVRKQAAWQAMSEPYRGLKTRVLDSMAAALLWGLLIGPVIYLFGVWPTGNPDLASRETLAQVRGWGLPIVLLIAVSLAAALPSYVGHALGRVRPAWSWIVLCSWSLPRNVALLIFLGFVATGLGSGEATVASVLGCGAALLWLLASSVLLIATAFFVTVNSTALEIDAPEAQIWGWSLVTSCGLPVLVPFLVVFGPAYGMALFGDRTAVGPAMAVTVAAALALSFLCFIFQLLFARGGLPPSSRPIPASRRRRARTVAVAAVALNLLGWFGTGGLDTVPMLSPRQEVVAGSGQIELDGVLGPGYPDVDYRRLTATTPLLVRLPQSPDLPVRLDSLDPGEIQQDHVLVLPGPQKAGGAEGAFLAWLWDKVTRLVAETPGPQVVHRLIVGPDESFEWKSARRPWRLSIEVLDDPAGLTEEWSYRLIEMQRVPRRDGADRTRSRWSYALGAEAPSPRGAVEVVVFRHQTTGARSDFDARITVSPDPADQSAQNCRFTPGPVVNDPPDSSETPRRTWKVPAESWPEAAINLRIPDAAPEDVHLVIGVRWAQDQRLQPPAPPDPA